MNLKVKIEIKNTETDEVIWTDSSSGDSEHLSGMFEDAGMNLGKMERHLPMVLARDYPEKEIECPDCGATDCSCPEGIEARGKIKTELT